MSRRWGYAFLVLGLLLGLRVFTPLVRASHVDLLDRGGNPDTAPVAAPSVGPGECIDTNLEGVSCTEPHFGEVFHVSEYPLAAPFPLPQDRFFQRWKERTATTGSRATSASRWQSQPMTWPSCCVPDRGQPVVVRSYARLRTWTRHR